MPSALAALSFTGPDTTHQGTIGGLAGTSTTGTPIGIAGIGGIAVGIIIEIFSCEFLGFFDGSTVLR